MDAVATLSVEHNDCNFKASVITCLTITVAAATLSVHVLTIAVTVATLSVHV